MGGSHYKLRGRRRPPSPVRVIAKSVHDASHQAIYAGVHRINAIRHLPVWAFHGDPDYIVPLQGMVETVNALKACGGDVKLTIYPGVGHNAADPAYIDYAKVFDIEDEGFIRSATHV